MGTRQSLEARRVVPPRCAPWPQEPFLAPLVPRWVGALLANYAVQIDQNSRPASGEEENWNLHYANATMTVKQPLEPTAPHCRFSCRHRSDSPPTHDNPHAAADKATRHPQSSASQLHLPERKHTATLAWQAPTSLANLGASHRHISRMHRLLGVRSARVHPLRLGQNLL